MASVPSPARRRPNFGRRVPPIGINFPATPRAASVSICRPIAIPLFQFANESIPVCGVASAVFWSHPGVLLLLPSEATPTCPASAGLLFSAEAAAASARSLTGRGRRVKRPHFGRFADEFSGGNKWAPAWETGARVMTVSAKGDPTTSAMRAYPMSAVAAIASFVADVVHGHHSSPVPYPSNGNAHAGSAQAGTATTARDFSPTQRRTGAGVKQAGAQHSAGRLASSHTQKKSPCREAAGREFEVISREGRDVYIEFTSKSQVKDSSLATSARMAPGSGDPPPPFPPLSMDQDHVINIWFDMSS